MSYKKIKLALLLLISLGGPLVGFAGGEGYFQRFWNSSRQIDFGHCFYVREACAAFNPCTTHNIQVIYFSDFLYERTEGEGTLAFLSQLDTGV